MRPDDLLQVLQKHRESVIETANSLYMRRLNKTIESLKMANYDEHELIADLQALGFRDLAQRIKKNLYV